MFLSAAGELYVRTETEETQPAVGFYGKTLSFSICFGLAALVVQRAWSS